MSGNKQRRTILAQVESSSQRTTSSFLSGTSHNHLTRLIWSLPSVLSSSIFGDMSTTAELFMLMATSKFVRDHVHHYLSSATSIIVSSMNHLDIISRYSCHQRLQSLQFRERIHDTIDAGEWKTASPLKIKQLDHLIDMNRSSLTSLLYFPSSAISSLQFGSHDSNDNNDTCIEDDDNDDPRETTQQQMWQPPCINTRIMSTIASCQRLRQLSLLALIPPKGKEVFPMLTFTKFPMTLQQLELQDVPLLHDDIHRLIPHVASLTLLSFCLPSKKDNRYYDHSLLVQPLKRLVESLSSCHSLSINFGNLALNDDNRVVNDAVIWEWKLPASMTSISLSYLGPIVPILLSTSLQSILLKWSYHHQVCSPDQLSSYIAGATSSLVSFTSSHPFNASILSFNCLRSLRFIGSTFSYPSMSPQLLSLLLDVWSLHSTLTTLQLCVRDESCSIAGSAILHTFTNLQSLFLHARISPPIDNELDGEDASTIANKMVGSSALSRYIPSMTRTSSSSSSPSSIVHIHQSLRHLKCSSSSLKWLNDWHMISLTSLTWHRLNDHLHVPIIDAFHHLLHRHSNVLVRLRIAGAEPQSYHYPVNRMEAIQMMALQHVIIDGHHWIPVMSSLIVVAVGQLSDFHLFPAIHSFTKMRLIHLLLSAQRINDHPLPFGLSHNDAPRSATSASTPGSTPPASPSSSSSSTTTPRTSAIIVSGRNGTTVTIDFGSYLDYPLDIVDDWCKLLEYGSAIGRVVVRNMTSRLSKRINDTLRLSFSPLQHYIINGRFVLEERR
jgi:hypothetical protein